MATITVSLPDDTARRLRDLASSLNVTPEDLVRASVDDLLSRPEDTFERAVERVLRKNAELYRRLA
ncbi:MAG: DNA-binding protein [Planctomycetes bacterium]|nr:DNA-binding protein [Planctomycetota bacterium]